MTDTTLGIIYAMKRSSENWDKAVAEYMANYSGSPIEDYSETVLNRIMKNAFVDYVETCDKPHIVIYELLHSLDTNGWYSLGHHLANILILEQVKDGDRFVNGFRDN